MPILLKILYLFYLVNSGIHLIIQDNNITLVSLVVCCIIIHFICLFKDLPHAHFTSLRSVTSAIVRNTEILPEYKMIMDQIVDMLEEDGVQEINEQN